MKWFSRQPHLRLEIGPVIGQAEAIAARVRVELPGHDGIARAADGVAGAAHEAESVARALRRPWGLHRLPAAFLAVALLLLAGWIYWRFLHVSTLTVAVPERDAVYLHERLSRDRQVRFHKQLTQGSRDNAALLAAGQVDLAFVQGGVPVPADLPRLEIVQPELVLYFVRQGIDDPRQLRRLITSVEGQGSHCVAAEFLRRWQVEDQVQFVHDWDRLTSQTDYAVPADVDAVFVIKDLANDGMLRAAERLAAAGFQLVSPELGARALTLTYLRPTEIPQAYLIADPPIPEQTVRTYSVATYLVARKGLTPRVMASAEHLLDADGSRFWEPGFEPTLSDTSEVLQTADSFLSILVYIGLAFLALLGFEVATYRKRFHELNTLISLISMHQSDKDVLGLSCDERRRENLLYLSICSDLLGLISVISGYYTQENSALLYSNLLELIHHRTYGLKLNIQTKILHASIALPSPAAMPSLPGPPPPSEPEPVMPEPPIG